MTRNVLQQTDTGSVVEYRESDEEREERLARDELELLKVVRFTPAQMKAIRRARSGPRRTS
jgi:hypothetical protein